MQEYPYIVRIFMVFIVSLLPGIGGPATTIPIGYGVLGLDLTTVTAVCIIGNIIPVPFIILFIRIIFDWLKKISTGFGRLVDKLEDKASTRGKRLERGVFLGLMLYVAVPLPLPGMGAWTAALIAAIFKIELKISFPAIAIGVVISSLIVVLGVLGVQGFIGLL